MWTGGAVIPDLDGGVLRVISLSPGLCMIATREAIEHSFASWSESIAKLISK
jgi:hypothetical protein